MKSTKKLKIVCAVSTVLFSSLACVTGALAWLSNPHFNTPASNFMAIKPIALNINFDLYYRNVITQNVVKVSGGDDTDLSLQTYRTDISETNKPFNNILKMTIAFEGGSSISRVLNTKINCIERTIGGIYNIGPAGATRTFIDTCGYKYHYVKEGEKENDFICDYISNLIQFKAYIYLYNIGDTKYLPDPSRECLIQTDKRIDYTSDETLFSSAKDIFDDISSANTFVSNGTKQKDINFSFASIPAEATSIEYYIEYNYNTELLNNYLNFCEYLRNREFDEGFDPTAADLNVAFQKDLVSIELTTDNGAKS